jgi:integrase/recombinase XerC
LRSFYRFLVRRGAVAATPIKNLALPKLEKRLPKFLTPQQMVELLQAPLKDLAARRAGGKENADDAPFLRDVAILETIYSCGLRVSELCGLRADDLNWNEGLVRVRGKGKKERLLPIGRPALEAIQACWARLPQVPTGAEPVFQAKPTRTNPF